jgi:hypothetical protein
MSIRHIVAFTLIGWYLMVPPLSRASRFDVDDQAALGNWTVLQAFNKATDCEDYRFRSQEMLNPICIVTYDVSSSVSTD